MDDDNGTISLLVQGQLDVDTFAAAVAGLRDLATALATNLTPDAPVTWELEQLAYGSASITLRAESDSPSAPATLTGAYLDVWEAIAEDRELDCPREVRDSARRLAALTRRERVTGLKCSAATRRVQISRLGPNAGRSSMGVKSIGVVTGQIESLSRRGDLHLTMVDDVFHSRVALHLRKGQEELGRNAWDTHATVHGTITEDADTGHPTEVRNITKVEPASRYSKGAWRSARGAFPWRPGDPPAEMLIRELRGRG